MPSMAVLNPVHALVVPFLLLVTVPLAVFAGITTTIAFSALILRVLAVYLDVALSLIPHYLGSRRPVAYPNTAALRKDAEPALRQHYFPLHHHHRGSLPRRADGPGTSASSLSSVSSAGSSQSSSLRRRRLRRSSSAIFVDPEKPPLLGPFGAGLAPSVGPARDFEGVGGWRLGSGDDDEDWTTINSRLELPDRQYHGRGTSSGSGSGHFRPPSRPTTPGEGGVLMMKGGRNQSPDTKRSSTSPNSSRTRTPSGPRIAFTPKNHGDSYFPSLTPSPKSTKKVSLGVAVDGA